MRPHGKYASVDAQNPEAFAQCDRCSFWRNRSDLTWQYEWAGTHLYNTGALICKERCIDVPQEQLRTIILPPDPPSVQNARVPNFAYEENGPVQSTLTATVAQGGMNLPVQDVTGFEMGTLIYVQLDNAAIGQFHINGIDTTNNFLSIAEPLSFSAPIYGVVSVANVEV